LKFDKQRNFVETKEQLASLKDDIKEQLRAGDPMEALLKYPKRLFSPSENTYRGKFGAFASSIETGSPEDKDKTATSGMLDSVTAPFIMAGRIFGGGVKFAISPGEEIRNTLAYLKEESPNTEIV